MWQGCLIRRLGKGLSEGCRLEVLLAGALGALDKISLEDKLVSHDKDQASDCMDCLVDVSTPYKETLALMDDFQAHMNISPCMLAWDCDSGWALEIKQCDQVCSSIPSSDHSWCPMEVAMRSPHKVRELWPWLVLCRQAQV